MTTIMHKLARRAAAAESGPGAQHTDTALPNGVLAIVTTIVDSDEVEVYVEAEPVITDLDASMFIDDRADAVEDEQEGLGEYLYDIDRIVAEETGEAWLRLLVGAYAGGRLAQLHEDGATPRVAAYRLLATVAKYTNYPDKAAKWTRLADEARAAGR